MNTKHRTTVVLVLVISIVLSGCGPRSTSSPETEEIVFKNVNIIPMTTEIVLKDSVYVKNGKIKAIGRFEDLNYSQEAEIIDAEGKYLLPGFSDMHVHIRDADDRILFLAYGITLVRNMWGDPELLTEIKRFEEENIPHPEIYTTGPLIDGKGAYWPGSFIIEDPEQVAEALLQMKTDGYNAIKVYDGLTLPVYDEIVNEAARNDLPVVGHVPFAVGVRHVIESGQLSIEHLSGYYLTDNSVDVDIIKLTVESGVWNCPTLVAVHQKAEILRNLYDNGATRIVAGTDTGISYIHAGSSLHEEFQLMNDVGLTPYQVLLTTTRNAAEMLGYEKRLGTIEAGKDADLVLLNENPLEDIANTSTIAGVMTKGVWLPKEQLQRMVDEYFQRNSKN